MSLDLYDFGYGGGAASKWQRSHKANVRARAAKKARLAAREQKRLERKEALADLKKRKVRAAAKRKAKIAAARAAGLPRPTFRGRKPYDADKKPQWKDMTGQRFGRLTVLRIAPVSKALKTSRIRLWWVKCDCGTAERMVSGSCLRQGIVKSCGCLLREWGRIIGKRATLGRRAPPLSVKMLAAAAELRSSGNVRIARLLEQAAPSVRRKERRKPRKQRRRTTARRLS